MWWSMMLKVRVVGLVVGDDEDDEGLADLQNGLNNIDTAYPGHPVDPRINRASSQIHLDLDDPALLLDHPTRPPPHPPLSSHSHSLV
jgi:hypothetical protein